MGKVFKKAKKVTSKAIKSPRVNPIAAVKEVKDVVTGDKDILDALLFNDIRDLGLPDPLGPLLNLPEVPEDSNIEPPVADELQTDTTTTTSPTTTSPTTKEELPKLTAAKQRNIARRRKGRSSNILTSPGGLLTPASGVKQTLLGV